MAEENKSNKKFGLGFNKLYTYVYLPLSIVLSFFIGVGRFSQYGNMTFSSVLGWSDSINVMLPMFFFVLGIFAFPLLISKKPSGRKMVLFSECFKALLCLPIIWGNLQRRKTTAAIIYSVLVLLMAFVYAYYLRRPKAFSGRSSMVVEAKEEPVEIKPTEEKITETKEEIIETPLPTEEKKEEEEEKSYDSIVITIKEETALNDKGEVLKKVTSSPLVFEKESPIIIERYEVQTFSDSSTVEIQLFNRSSLNYSSTTWTMGGIREVVSHKPINSGEVSLLWFTINIPTDQFNLSLVSLEDENGNVITLPKNRTPVAKPEKHPLNELSKEDGFDNFLSSYKEETGINGSWITEENVTGDAVTCPRCGTPILKNEGSCQVCKLSLENASKFHKDTVLDKFRGIVK